MAPLLDLVESSMGFVPNSMLSMDHWTDLLAAFGGLGTTVLQTGEVDGQIKQIVAMVSSRDQGCHYCQSHTSHSAHRSGRMNKTIIYRDLF
jgi:AhpD family alkylhydroperoxidase